MQLRFDDQKWSGLTRLKLVVAGWCHRVRHVLATAQQWLASHHSLARNELQAKVYFFFNEQFILRFSSPNIRIDFGLQKSYHLL